MPIKNIPSSRILVFPFRVLLPDIICRVITPYCAYPSNHHHSILHGVFHLDRLIHKFIVLLGLDDLILMIGGIGVIGILVASLIPNLKRFKVQLRLGLGFVVSMMLIGYFVTNHDLHYISEDYLGIITKLAEIGLLQQLLTNVDSRES